MSFLDVPKTIEPPTGLIDRLHAILMIQTPVPCRRRVSELYVCCLHISVTSSISHLLLRYCWLSQGVAVWSNSNSLLLTTILNWCSRFLILGNLFLKYVDAVFNMCLSYIFLKNLLNYSQCIIISIIYYRLVSRKMGQSSLKIVTTVLWYELLTNSCEFVFF